MNIWLCFKFKFVGCVLGFCLVLNLGFSLGLVCVWTSFGVWYEVGVELDCDMFCFGLVRF